MCPTPTFEGDHSALLGGRGGRLMSPFCFPATPLQAPSSSAPPSPARTRHPHRFVGGRAGGKVSGQSPGVGGGAVCLHLHSAPGVPRAGSRVGSPEVGRFRHQVCGWLFFLITWVTKKATLLLPRPGSGVIPLRVPPRGMWELALTTQLGARRAL